MRSLARGVQQQNQQLLLDKAVEAYQAQQTSLVEFDKEIQRIRDIPEAELERNDVGLNWEQIAKMWVRRHSDEMR